MSRRIMARPAASPKRARRTIVAPLAATAAILGLAAAVASSGLLAGPSPAPTQNADRGAAGLPSPRPSSASPTPSRTATPTRSATLTTTPTPTPTAMESPGNSASPTPDLPPGVSPAPTRPDEFDLRAQRIDIGFPLRPDTSYRYRDNFLDSRDGRPELYNHARMEKGTLLRLHDGTDIYARAGEPLVAPFDGAVVDPATRWRPWDRERYGRTIAIVSHEPTTAGYVALLAHADRVWVEPGTRVTRGQVVGTVGRTGNAEIADARAQLHFELRAPFALDFRPIGHDRVTDAFNPYPSLVAADPKRT